jgi:hypothetical protein
VASAKVEALRIKFLKCDETQFFPAPIRCGHVGELFSFAAQLQLNYGQPVIAYSH